MDIKELTKRAQNIRQAYDNLNQENGQQIWDLSDYMQGLVGDIGDLAKLVMAKENKRTVKGDIDSQLKHELSDCLWSLLIIAHNLNIDLEQEFLHTMKELEHRVEQQQADATT